MLRRKVIRQILIIELAILCLFGIGYMAVFKSYIRLENQEISTDIARVKSALERELEHLDTFNKSWAKIDILYHSLTNNNPNRVALRRLLMNDIVSISKVDRAAVFDKDDNLVIARIVDHEQKLVVEPNDTHPAISDFHAALAVANKNDQNSALGLFIDSEQNIRFVSVEPLVSQNVDEGTRGTIVSSIQFDQEALATLVDIVLQEIEILTVEDFSKNPGHLSILEPLEGAASKIVTFQNSDNTRNSFSFLEDINGSPALILSVHSRRQLITQAKETIIGTSVGLLIFFMFLAIYIIVFLDNRILRRLKILSADVTDLSENQHMGKTLRVVGSDEISHLTKAFNNVLFSLEQSHRDVKHERDKAETTLASIGDAVIATDLESKVQYLNRTAAEITGKSVLESIGKDITSVFNPVDEDGVSDSKNLARRCMQLKARVKNKYNRLENASNKKITIESEANPIFDHDDKINGAVIVFRDVSEAKTLQQNLVYQASHDSLTGLSNRAEFEKKLDEIMHSPHAEKHQNHLLFIDLDRFKIVNDSCGHLAGDKVLRELSALMKSLIRQSDIIARIGGDEFGVILHDCPFEKAFEVAEKLRKKVAEFRFFRNEKSFSFGASIGLIDLEYHIYDTEAGVLSLADKACMAAKNAGRNRVHVFKSTDAHVAEHQNQTLWVNRITDALEHNQFTLYFQKIIPAEQNTNGKVKAEVLLRMLDKTGSVIAPGIFLPAAERYGLMQLIDKWVIKNFFQWHIENAAALENFESFSINLSGQSLSDDEFLAFLIDYATHSQVDAKSICFEITETAAIQNITNTLATFTNLREKGFTFALDDFGSGMSSFNYLKHLPIDSLKIDGIFIRNIDNQPFDYSMVRSINELAHLMGISTTAEFIETERVSALVSGLGVDYLQGYHLHRPEPLSVLIDKKLLKRGAQ